ncbi:MAG: hypothetical protein QG671_3735, partial [Actinomycetota bacterium]|nr:hypothetical protein [Actinomycetota bacterium]
MCVMAFAADSLPPQSLPPESLASPPPESPAPESESPESRVGGQRPAGGARSGADAGWAVPGVTGQTSRDRGSSASGPGSARDRGRGRRSSGGRGRSEDVDPSEVLTAAQLEALADVSAAVGVLAEVAGSVSGVQALMVARQVHTLSNRLSGVHAQVLASATTGQAWAGDG